LAALALPVVGATSAHAAVAPAAYTTASSAAAGAAGTAATGSGDVAPLASVRITERYGVPGPWAAGHHTGVDLAAAVGTDVRSVGAGTVVRSGWDGAYGDDVLVRMDGGDYTLYAHLSHVSVTAGEQVAAGQQVGLSGATGHVTGPHLHFEVRTSTHYGSDIDPLAYLRAHGVAI
jgi:murein DD-endopeptidase MepM/ murein hydrolase activator NlpD